jgi:hypothetical protein
MSAVRAIPRPEVVSSRTQIAVGANDIPGQRIAKIVNTAVDGVDLATATTDIYAGVTDAGGMQKPVAYGAGTLNVGGTVITHPSVALVVAGAGISRNQRLTSDGSGRATPAASGNSQIGIAMCDAAGLGSIVEVWLSPPGAVAP